MRLIFPALLAIFLLSSSIIFAKDPVESSSPSPTPSSTATTPAETKLGEETAKQIEKDFKLINDEVMLKKLNDMAAVIAPQTQRPDVVYTCKIIDIREINAMAIPGGTIYFTQGLLSAVESDDELAGVMAHEIAHNSLRHIYKLKNKEKELFIPQIIATIFGMYAADKANQNSNDSNGINPFVLIGVAQQVKESIINGYSKDVEGEADTNAVRYLAKTKIYDPVGIYSVIIGFRKMEKSSIKVNLGYIENHPSPQDRLVNINKELTELRVPKNLWRVINFHPKVIPPKEGEFGYTLALDSQNLFTYLAGDGNEDAPARANTAAQAIDEEFNSPKPGLSYFDVNIMSADDGNKVSILLRKRPVITLTTADIDPDQPEKLEVIASQIKAKIRQVITNETLRHGWETADKLL